MDDGDGRDRDRAPEAAPPRTRGDRAALVVLVVIVVGMILAFAVGTAFLVAFAVFLSDDCSC